MLICKICLRKFIHKALCNISFDWHCYYSDNQQHSTCKLENAKKTKNAGAARKIASAGYFIT